MHKVHMPTNIWKEDICKGVNKYHERILYVDLVPL